MTIVNQFSVVVKYHDQPPFDAHPKITIRATMLPGTMTLQHAMDWAQKMQQQECLGQITSIEIYANPF